MVRRLAAVLLADIAGYTRLIRNNEASTLQCLTALRDLVLAPIVSEFHGRIVKSMGDGFFVEFASAVDAVNCALRWQESVDAFQADRDSAAQLRFRIGINLGDLIVQGDDLYGDGVNVAARLETLASPGEICISGDVYRQVRDKIDVKFDDLGERPLKNVAEPVRVYAVRSACSESGTSAFAAPLPIPHNKPSIAVLPFANMSGDPDQEYFSDGVTEDIITELSRFRELFTIARNSSFLFKGKSDKVQNIASELGVRYILEGSVRLAGARIRITAQLVDASGGHHIWSERYDREIADLFTLQDEIAKTVAGTVAGRLKLTAEQLAERKPIESLEAYDYALRAQSVIANSKASNLLARQSYAKAIELDPSLTRGHIGLAVSYVIEWYNSWAGPDDDPLALALAHAARAVELDITDGKAHLFLGHVQNCRGQFDEAGAHLRRALELNPSDADAYAYMGVHLDDTNQPEASIENFRTAMRLNPFYPAWYLWALGNALFSARRYAEALSPLREAVSRNPKSKRARIALAATYAQLDRIDEARDQIAKLLAEHPDASLTQEKQWRFPSIEAEKFWFGGLRNAGLPE